MQTNNKPLKNKSNFILSIFSFLIPLFIWCIVSYVPMVWHPPVQITDPGAVNAFQIGDRIEKADYYQAA